MSAPVPHALAAAGDLVACDVPVVPHPRDAFARGLMPWDTAPRPVAVAPVSKPRPALPTYYAAAEALGVRTSSLWKRLRRKGVGPHDALPLETWRTLAAGLARRPL